MAKLIYRVVSACAALGDGYPRASIQAAIEGRVDAIVSDAGSIDAGPYYLGSGRPYFEREAVKADYRHMVEAALRCGAPVIVGNCGMAGAERNLAWMLEVAKEVFAELEVRDAKVAVIPADVAPALVVAESGRDNLRPAGLEPRADAATLRDSVIVAQMGIHPLITALAAGARFIFAGRACDAALYAADMVRHGIDAGLAYHVGHVLGCGAQACDPGSPSDCLVAEIHDDDSAVFDAPSAERRCTPASIAAHALYQTSHPELQRFPEGVLLTDRAAFYAVDARRAGIRGSRFLHSAVGAPLSIRLEGARGVGACRLPLPRIGQRDLHRVPPEPAGPGDCENGPAHAASRLAPLPGSLLAPGASEAYEWSLCHVLDNDALIRTALFPIRYFRANGARWTALGEERPRYFAIGLPPGDEVLDERSLSLIADAPPALEARGHRPLREMASVIRRRNAGAGRLSFDILFRSSEDYELGLASNLFHAAHLAEVLRVAPARVVGSYFADSCRAIKITLECTPTSAAPDDRDVCGAQQQARLESLLVPLIGMHR